MRDTSIILKLILDRITSDLQMPPSKEKNRGYVGYRVPPDIEKKVNALIEKKEFDTKADILSLTLRYWFDNKDSKTQKELFKAWALSPEGKAEIKQLIREIIDAEK
jgi:hypothetical protein